MKKEIVFVIEYCVSLEDIQLDEALEKLRETGSAEIVDARVQIPVERKSK